VELYLHSPNTPSWRGAHLKHRDNFTLVYRKEYCNLYLTFLKIITNTHVSTTTRAPVSFTSEQKPPVFTGRGGTQKPLWMYAPVAKWHIPMSLPQIERQPHSQKLLLTA